MNKRQSNKSVLRYLILSFIGVVASFPSFSQKVEWGIYLPIGSCQVESLVVDPSSHEIVFGGTYSAAGVSIAGIVLPPVPHGHDGFLAKADTAGKVLWARNYGTSVAELNIFQIDKFGNLYVSGFFNDSLFFGIDTLTTAGESDAGFVGKLDRDGNCIWARKIPHIVTLVAAVDLIGNIYVSTETENDASMSHYAMVAKYNNGGNKLWETLLTTNGNGGDDVEPVRIRFNSRNQPVICMNLLGSTMINGQSYGRPDANFSLLLFKLYVNGSVQWFKLENKSPYDNYYAMGIDGLDNIIVLTSNVYNRRKYDVDDFITKYDSLGDRITAISQYTTYFGTDLAMDGLGNFYAAGDFKESMRWGPHYLSGGDQSMFWVKLNKEGETVWTFQKKNLLADDLDWVYKLVRSPDGSLYSLGLFSSNHATFGDVTLNSIGLGGVFIIKIKDQTANQSNLNLGADSVVCTYPIKLVAGGFINYAWQDGSNDSTFLADGPGTYSLTATDFSGATHIDTLILGECVRYQFPNVFTPNGDPKNEFFVIPDLDTGVDNSLTVYDRIGQRVFFSDSYQNNWNGAGLLDGVYYYFFRDGRREVTYKGWVQIIR